MGSFSRQPSRRAPARQYGFAYESTRVDRAGVPLEPVSDDDLGRLVPEVYAAHVGMFCAGVESDDVFIQTRDIANERPRAYYLTVQVRGPGGGEDAIRFVHTLMPLFGDGQEDMRRFASHWQAFMDARKAMSDDDLNAIVDETVTRMQFVPLWTAMAAKGIEVQWSKLAERLGCDERLN